MRHATWDEAKQGSIAAWERMGAFLDSGDVEGFRRALAEGWPLCSRAQRDIAALGIPKVQMYRCDFCRGNLDYGGCSEYVTAALDAVAAADLAGARREVDRMIEAFRTMTFDEA
jgi:hypothetical protein